jgi:hypothetical protein
LAAELLQEMTEGLTCRVIDDRHDAGAPAAERIARAVTTARCSGLGITATGLRSASTRDSRATSVQADLVERGIAEPT